MALRLVAWRQGHPDPGRVVYVWWFSVPILATWDGAQWRTADNDALPDGLWWHEQ